MENDSITALVMATLLEAKPFVTNLDLKELEKAPFMLFKNNQFILIISGIGKANAAMATAYCCRKFNPDHVFNLGASGATDFNHSLGEIYHIEKIIEFDRPILGTGAPRIYNPYMLEGFKTATLSTADRPVLLPDERIKIAKQAHLLDMEGASVIQACERFQTRGYVFKFVSDTPDHINSKEIVKNIRLYRKTFYQFFVRSVMPELSIHSI